MKTSGNLRFGLIVWAALLGAAAWGQDASPVHAEVPVRGGSIVVKVADYEAARQETLKAAGAEGAELLGARTVVDGEGRKHGELRFRLPAPQLPALLGSVRSVGRLYGENVTTTDHASEYEELARRIVRLREHEARLSGVLGDGRRLRGGDLLYVQERLFRASVDESLLAQRRADLERAAGTNTVLVELFEPGALPPPAHPTTVNLAAWFGQAEALARGTLERLLARGATAAAYSLVYAPLWLPAMLILLLLLRALWRRRGALAGGLLRLIQASRRVRAA